MKTIKQRLLDATTIATAPRQLERCCGDALAEILRLERIIEEGEAAPDLPPIGTLLKIKWRDPNADWPYFWLVKTGRERIKLKGADYPDGSANHDGGVFWARVDSMDSIEEAE